MIFRRFNQEDRVLNKYSTVSPRDALKDYVLKERYKDKEKTLIEASGSPFLWFKNISQIPCYCLDEFTKSGNTNDLTCHGNGYLRSYEKYGYQTFTFAKTHPDLIFDNIAFADGWGYKEIMTIKNGSKALIILPPLTTTSFKEFIFFDIGVFDAKPGFHTYLEFSYDNIGFQRLEAPEDLDLTQGVVYFRAVLSRMGEPPHGGIRYIRLRFRELDPTLLSDSHSPPDVYVPISAQQRQTDDLQIDRQRLDIVSDTPGWTLHPVHSGDFVVDVVGTIDGSKKNSLYLLNNVKLGIHGNDEIEYRRDFELKFIAKNSHLRRLYTVPL